MDKALELFFADYQLGILRRTDNGYAYTSIIDGEQAVLKEHLIINGYDKMFSNINNLYDSLPPVFDMAYKEIMLGAETLQDLKQSANNDPFDILFAHAGTEQEDSGIHFRQAYIDSNQRLIPPEEE